MEQKQRSVEDFIAEDIIEVISGFASEHRARGRVAGLTAVRAVIPMKEFRRQLRSRIAGRRLMDDRGDPLMRALKRARVPSLVELRKRWLPAAFAKSEGVVITDDTIEMTVDIPPLAGRRTRARSLRPCTGRIFCTLA